LLPGILSVAFDTSASGKAARAAAVVDPGERPVLQSAEKHVMKYLIMRERVFGIGDDHWVTFRK
jgi:hypothetical protein